ncbi:membrane associated RING finger, putative [Perkinsus marinus ATCC 50983]|uniref:Membrane associated RING finger, putative n=1 Tax=Perkinsus marinus (strain ATCC 50983 / TXsc) TaxID=423536 RepID=C5KD92_PERM5|nr:membrane associated RING finger, putative [Perkinsus marinus ATCC 50983]EER17525.1 membrane associated RING finger, putative [Perkinsus marinus ATCC 50983]|eukprot:XP_002785729.1 membrane associated RING finger, putative [Perkinsus marinus ATCC 50983]
MSRSPPPPPIHIEATTWTRDSHELFDYESRSIAKTNFEVVGNARLIRRNGEVSMESDCGELVEPAEHTDYLLKCVNFDTKYLIQPAEKQPEGSRWSAKKLWLVIKDLGPYSISEGDVVKLGRFKLRVRQLCGYESEELVRPDLMGPESQTSMATCAPPEADGKPCRICLLEASGSDEDPLVEACACRGSIRYVHLGCLRHWVEGRLSLHSGSEQQGSTHTYLFRQLACELCRTNYPLYVRLHDGHVEQLVPMPETRAPYMVLENMMRVDPIGGGQTEGADNQSSVHARGVYVISLAGKKMLRLGRGHESDVRIADVSISRWHATVSFTEDGRFVLEDHNSKFGTLVALRRPRVIEAAPPPEPVGEEEVPKAPVLTVQAGRTVFRISRDVPPPLLPPARPDPLVVPEGASIADQNVAVAMIAAQLGNDYRAAAMALQRQQQQQLMRERGGLRSDDEEDEEQWGNDEQPEQ